MIILSLLLVIQAPFVLLSGTLSDVPSVLLDEQPEDKASPIMGWHNDTMSSDDQSMLLIEEIKNKAKDLELLLPEKDAGPELVDQLDFGKVVRINEVDLIKQVFQENIGINSPHIEIGKKGQYLLLSSFACTDLFKSINQVNYALTGGVVKLLDLSKGLFSYSAFTVNEKGISFDRLKDLSTAEFVSNNTTIAGMSVRILCLPEVVETSDGVKVDLKYQYMIYQAKGLSETPYPIHPLKIDNNLLVAISNDIASQLNGTEASGGLFKQCGLLIKFIRLWKAVKPDHVFENRILNDISFELQNLEQYGIEEEKIRRSLGAAAEFILYNAGERPLTGFLFATILLEQEPTIRGPLFTGQGGTFDPKAAIEESVCDDLSDELVFYDATSLHDAANAEGNQVNPPQESMLPYRLNLPCRNNPNKLATFTLIAKIRCDASLVTYGLDHSADKPILKVAQYTYLGEIPTVFNLPIEDSQILSIRQCHEVLIYQHVRKDQRFSKTKVAP